MCAVLDTNIWRSSHLLSDPVSASFLFALENVGGKLGMPEVIEREVFKHGATMGREARESIEKHLRTIRALVGQSPGIALPSDRQFQEAVRTRLSALEDRFHRIPFTTDVALRALDRVDLKKPPSHAGQQYKDCAIWETCLDLATKFDVHLATADKAFYDQTNFARGLEGRLRQELDTSGLTVTLHASLDSLVATLTENVAESLDASSATQAIFVAIGSQLRSSVEKDGWVLSDLLGSRLEAFVTRASWSRIRDVRTPLRSRCGRSKRA